MRTVHSGALKYLYPVIVRVTGLSGIVILIFTFLVFPRSTNTMELDEEIQIIIEQIDIPQTEQFDQPPPPARPSVPVESESEDLADDVTLDEFNLDEFDAWDAPPPPPEGPRVKFIPYDDPPIPLKPIRPRYPEIAQEMGIQGRVYVNFIISKNGNITNIRMRGPDKNLEKEAERIIARLPRMTPGKQRGRPVRVPFSIPITFRLR